MELGGIVVTFKSKLVIAVDKSGIPIYIETSPIESVLYSLRK